MYSYNTLKCQCPHNGRTHDHTLLILRLYFRNCSEKKTSLPKLQINWFSRQQSIDTRFSGLQISREDVGGYTHRGKSKLPLVQPPVVERNNSGDRQVPDSNQHVSDFYDYITVFCKEYFILKENTDWNFFYFIIIIFFFASSLLGRGAFGEVFRGILLGRERNGNNTDIAVKVVKQ